MGRFGRFVVVGSISSAEVTISEKSMENKRFVALKGRLKSFVDYKVEIE
jgi:hypothetical protein